MELEIKNISKTIKKRKIVNGVSLNVKSGQVVGLLGPNGAGKTTSFYMVVGLIPPDEGEIFLDGESVREMPMFKRAQLGIGYLPQEASIFRRLTVKENLIVAFESKKIKKSFQDEKLKTLIEEFDLTGVENSYGYSLSGGERRRVEIARALAASPKFLLLDEPFAGIDPIAVADIQKMVRKLTDKGIGILITDHNVRETLNICDYAYILKEGEIEVQGTVEQVANSKVARKFYLGENFKL